MGAILASSFAMAQNQEQTIDSVQIFGRNKIKHEQADFKKNAQSTETLGSYEINRNNSAFIEQSLNTLSGVQVNKRTNLGSQQVIVRGYGNDQKSANWGVKFYLNNVPITSADNTTTLDGIDFSLINNIEVIKGPAGTMFGSGVGGVIRFYMRPETQKGVTLSQKLVGGSFKLLQTATRVDAVGDNYSVMFNYGHIQSDGYRPRGTSLRNDYSFLGNFKLNSKQNITVYASQNYSFEGTPGQISYEDYYNGYDPGNLAYAKKNSNTKLKSTRASVNHDWQILPNLSNNTSIFYFNLDSEHTSAGSFENETIPNYGLRSVFNLKNNLNENFSNEVELGAELMMSQGLATKYKFTGTNANNPLEVKPLSSGYYFKTFNQALNYFAVDRITYKPWYLTLIAGVSANNTMYERTDLLAMQGLIPGYNKDFSFDKKFETVFMPHIALQKTYKKQIFNLSYSEGYNSPTSASSFNDGLQKASDDLQPERAKMWDFSVQGLLANTRFDYQVSLFRINVTNKLSKLSGSDVNNNPYTYFANTGSQRNQGFEVSLGYVYNNDKAFIKTIRPFMNLSIYDFRYTNFRGLARDTYGVYDHKNVVGVPRSKYAIGLDINTQIGLYLNNTFTYLGDVYADFENANRVKGFTQYNAKLGYKKSLGKFELDIFVAGNNLTSQINYTYLFIGNSIGDSDKGSNYPSTTDPMKKADVTPGSKNAYFFGGLNIKYHF